ncbi:hypothetical protein [Amycolatopsis panacis]|nr:hypothetical protein [Amycolatopsis panacis]
MTGTEPGETGDLESVARLVRMSDTAPMPRVDAAPRAQRPVTDDPAVPAGVFGGALDDRSGSAAGQLAAAGGPATAELSGLDELLDGTSAETVGRRPVRSLIVAGAAVVAFGGLGVWALWPSSSGDAAGEAVPPPAVPSSSAPPTAITTLTASPVPLPATADVRDSTIRASSKETAPPPVTSSEDNSDDVAPGSSQRQRNDHRKPPHRHGQE